MTISCILCNNQASSFVCKNKRTYYFCSNCELIFADNEHWLDPVTEKSRYEEHDNTIENEGYVKFLSNFINKGVLPFVSDNIIALDYGCGPGPVLQTLLERRGIKTTVYDPYFAPDESYKQKKYDLITSTEVFEHFYDPYSEIEHLLNLCKKEGLLSVMTYLHPGKENFCDWWYKWDPTHVTFYNMKTVKWIAENFEVELLFSDEKRVVVFQKMES